jgi:hypothetical protein
MSTYVNLCVINELDDANLDYLFPQFEGTKSGNGVHPRVLIAFGKSIAHLSMRHFASCAADIRIYAF